MSSTSSTQACACSSTRSFFSRNSRRLQRIREYIPSALLRSDHANAEPGPYLNRFNQTVVSYDASKEEKVEALKKKNVATEQRLKEREF